MSRVLGYGLVMTLGLDRDELATCVSCGLCLPHCPTYRVTGEEALSPRGRIDAMRSVQSGSRSIDEQFISFMETCVQCRGCEPACPSGVPFGHLMEQTRQSLAEQRQRVPRTRRWALSLLNHRSLLLFGSTLLAMLQRLHLLPRSAGLPLIPIRRGRRIQPTGTDAVLFLGCVMDAWQRQVHRATLEVANASGIGLEPRSVGCCGALQTHAGLHDEAAASARRIVDALGSDRPIVVNSAGCGAAMKEYGRLLGTPEAQAFSSQVRDICEIVDPALLRVDSQRRSVVIVQDPCHLRHVQGAHLAMRQMLGSAADLVELDDAGLCCGAGGAYALDQPELAASIRDRKVAAIERARNASGATVMASANPGCAFHLQPALEGIEIKHPSEIVAEALS